MPTLKGLCDQVTALAEDQLTLVQDKSRPWSEKQAEYDGRKADIEAINSQIDALKGVDDLAPLLDRRAAGDEPKRAKNLGEHYVQHASEALKGAGQRFSAGAPEWTGKANDDVNTTGDLRFPQIDETVTLLARQQPTIADLLASGTITAASLTYYVQQATDGSPASVAEGDTKAQVHYNFDTVTDALTKLAGYTKISDEMREDLSFLVSVINNELALDLRTLEETQLLNGNGTAPNLEGIMNRTGVQTEAWAVDPDTMGDTLFRAMTDVQTATFLAPDGLVINPADYQSLRLARDSNGQYYGGGFFQGPYGNGGLAWAQPVWGLRTVVTSAISQGTGLVGAFSQGTVYRKGGIRVEATNSNEADFINNRITIRAEERLALAVRRPSAFVKVDLTQAAA
ncbi:MAG: phage major capsid protein [Streptosporangiales bacterium]